jgi:hypothetical protein
MPIPLTLRLVKGTKLTYAELDNNFKEIDKAIGNLQNFSRAGYMKFGSGLVIQWGSGGTTTGKEDSFSFPTTFPTECQILLAGEVHTGGWDSGVLPYPNTNPTIYGMKSVTRSGFKLSGCRISGGTPNGAVYQGGLGFCYVAFGY